MACAQPGDQASQGPGPGHGCKAEADLISGLHTLLLLSCKMEEVEDFAQSYLNFQTPTHERCTRLLHTFVARSCSCSCSCMRIACSMCSFFNSCSYMWLQWAGCCNVSKIEVLDDWWFWQTVKSVAIETFSMCKLCQVCKPINRTPVAKKHTLCKPIHQTPCLHFTWNHIHYFMVCLCTQRSFNSTFRELPFRWDNHCFWCLQPWLRDLLSKSEIQIN